MHSAEGVRAGPLGSTVACANEEPGPVAQATWANAMTTPRPTVPKTRDEAMAALSVVPHAVGLQRKGLIEPSGRQLHLKRSLWRPNGGGGDPGQDQRRPDQLQQIQALAEQDSRDGGP